MVDELSKKRKEIQAEIAKVSKQRNDHVAKELASKNEAADSSFGAAVKKAVREQAQKKGYTFEEE